WRRLKMWAAQPGVEPDGASAPRVPRAGEETAASAPTPTPRSAVVTSTCSPSTASPWDHGGAAAALDPSHDGDRGRGGTTLRGRASAQEGRDGLGRGFTGNRMMQITLATLAE